MINNMSILLAILSLCCFEKAFTYNYQKPNTPSYQQQNVYPQRSTQIYLAQQDEENLEEDILNDPDAPD
jgi:hypothetical protein